MKLDRVEMRLDVHETGTTATWWEPSVIRGNVGPNEQKPADPQADQPGWKEPEQHPMAPVMEAMGGVLARMNAATKAAQEQVVYRMVRRTMACQDDTVLSTAVTQARRASRVLDGLLRRGAVPEQHSCGGQSLVQMTPQIMMVGPRPDQGEPPGPRKPVRKKPRRRRKK